MLVAKRKCSLVRLLPDDAGGADLAPFVSIPFAGDQASHSTMLIVVICVAFVVLIVGVGFARLRNNGGPSSEVSGWLVGQERRSGGAELLDRQTVLLRTYHTDTGSLGGE